MLKWTFTFNWSKNSSLKSGRRGGNGRRIGGWGSKIHPRREQALCVCMWEGKWCSPCSSLSSRRSRWLSRVEGTADPQGALGTPSALHGARSLPGRHSPNTQALTIKTTPNKHLPNTLTTCGRAEGGASRSRGAGVLGLRAMPLPAWPRSRPDMERPFKSTWKMLWLKVTQRFLLA